MRRFKVRISGHLVHTMIGCDDLNFGFRRNGCWEASFQARVGDGWRHPAFSQGALFEILYGGDRPWLGVLNGIDWETGEMTAKGMIRVLEDYRARVWTAADGLVPTWNPRAAVDAVISPNLLSGRAAVPILRDNSVPDVDLLNPRRDADVEPMQLLALLELASKQGHGIPSIGGDGVLRFLPDPTTRTWSVHPRVVDIGNAGGEDTATRIFVTYQFKTSLAWDQVTAYAIGDTTWWDGQLWRKATGGGGGVKPVEGGGFWNPVGQPEPWSKLTEYEVGDFVTYDHSITPEGVGYVFEVTSGPPAVGTTPISGGFTYRGQLPYDDTAEAIDGTVEPYREAVEIDVRSVLGPISASEAEEIAAAALTEALMSAFTSDIEVTPLKVAGRHGAPIVPWVHKANELGRVNGVADPRLGQPFIEPISDEYQVNAADSASPTGLIKVVGREARGHVEVMQAALEARRRREWVG